MGTIKEELDRTARGFARVIGISLAVCGTVGIAWDALGLPNEVMLVAVGAFLIALVTFLTFLAAGVRCPRCGERLEEFYRRRLLWWANIRYCPQCGLDFRTPADNQLAD